MKLTLPPCHLATLPRSPGRRGSAFIVTLWVIAALSGLVLVLAQSVRTEALASANRLALAQADAAEKGAEQFALSAVDTEVASPGTLATDNVFTADPLAIGGAYVWFIKPDRDDETAISFGLSDEAGKVDINKAGAADMLPNLPNITQENIDCLVDWRDADSNPGNQGAEDSYYMALNPPYHCKNAPFETVEELLLVKSYDADVLWGLDRTRSGHVPADANVGAPTVSFGQSTSNRGLFPFITVYGVKASTVPAAASGTSGASSRLANVNAENQTQLRSVLNKYISGAAQQVLVETRNQRPFQNVWDWAIRTHLTPAQLSAVINYVTIVPSPALAKINVNTAPEPVLMCIPGFAQSDADAIANYRQANPNPVNPADITWLLNVVPQNKLRFSGSFLTGVSYCFSADILVCSSDGRAFKRSRIVIDASSGASKIIYRRDTTAYGWPIDPQIRATLRSGQPIPTNVPQAGGALP